MQKHIILINGQDPDHFPNTFFKAANAHGCTSENIDTKGCIISVGYEDNNVVVVSKNTILPTTDTYYAVKRTGGDTYRTYLISKILADKTSIFVDEANLHSDKTADKITMTALLPLIGVGVPRSIITDLKSYEQNREYIRKTVTYPAVVKKTGSKGKNVWKVANENELETRLSQDEELSLIQEYIPNDHDLRVFILDGKHIATIKRSSADGFYNNVSQGGKAERVEIEETEKNICIKATSLAKLRLAGVDLVRSERGPLIFEVNKAPQLDIFTPAAGFDIEEFYSNHVLDELIRDSK